MLQSRISVSRRLPWALPSTASVQAGSTPAAYAKRTAKWCAGGATNTENRVRREALSLVQRQQGPSWLAAAASRITCVAEHLPSVLTHERFATTLAVWRRNGEVSDPCDVVAGVFCELAQRCVFDLSHALTRDVHHLTNLLERHTVRVSTHSILRRRMHLPLEIRPRVWNVRRRATAAFLRSACRTSADALAMHGSRRWLGGNGCGSLADALPVGEHQGPSFRVLRVNLLRHGKRFCLSSAGGPRGPHRLGSFFCLDRTVLHAGYNPCGVT